MHDRGKMSISLKLQTETSVNLSENRRFLGIYLKTRHTRYNAIQRDTKLQGIPQTALYSHVQSLSATNFKRDTPFFANAIHLFQFPVNLECLLRQRDTLRTQRDTHFFNTIHFFCQRDTSFSVARQLGAPSKATQYTKDPT